MSSELGSAASLSRSAGGLSAALQQRNRYWIQFLEERLVAVEGKLRASGDLERARQQERGDASGVEKPDTPDQQASPAGQEEAPDGWAWSEQPGAAVVAPEEKAG